MDSIEAPLEGREPSPGQLLLEEEKTPRIFPLARNGKWPTWPISPLRTGKWRVSAPNCEQNCWTENSALKCGK